MAMLPALVVVAVGVVALAVLVVAVLGPLRRFSRVNRTFRSGVTAQAAGLVALMNSRRPGREGADKGGPALPGRVDS